jgi:hypothetical protein
VFVAVVESCLYWTRALMSMSQDICLLMWTEVFSTRCSWYLFIWSIGCHKYEEKNSEACALPDSASSFSNYVVFEAQILVLRNLRKKLEHKASEKTLDTKNPSRAMTIWVDAVDLAFWCIWC